MNKRYAKRLDDIEPFRVIEVLDRARRLQQQGRDIVHMEVGEPDFTTAKPIIAAARIALDKGYTRYSDALGLPALREAIAAFYASRYGVDLDPQRVVVTPGASGALLLLAALLINPGDGMLMTDPGYPCNRNFLRLVEGEGQLVPVTAADRYQLTGAAVLSHWRSNTVGAMVASPANPTGELLSHEQLTDLYKAISSKKGYLLVDEIYHGLTYDEDATSILEVTDDAFVINSFSKYFGMTGWRLGWLVAPPDAVPELEKLAQNLFISTSTIAQHAALMAFHPSTLEVLEQRRHILGQRRDFLLPQLRRLGFDIAHQPAGALYLYANVSAMTNDSQQFCLDLLEQHGIALTPGLDFGRYQARQHVRFAYTTDMTQLEKGVQRLWQLLG